MVKAAVDTDPPHRGLDVFFRGSFLLDSEWSLVARRALLTPFMECVAVQLRELLTWDAGESVQAIGVLGDDMLDEAQVEQLQQSFVGVSGAEILVAAEVTVTSVLGWTWR